MDAPVNQKITAPPVIRPSRNGAWSSDRFATSAGSSRFVSITMIEKIIVVAPTTAVPISTGFAVALNVLPPPSAASRMSFATPEVDVEPEVPLQLLLDVRQRLDDRQLEHRLGVVGDRAVRVDRDRDRAHAEEAEGDEAEREDGRGDHQLGEALRADQEADRPSGRRSPGPASRR